MFRKRFLTKRAIAQIEGNFYNPGMRGLNKLILAILVFVLTLSGCSFIVTGQVPDPVTFAPRNPSWLNPEGVVPEKQDELNQTLTSLPLGLNQLATHTAVEATRVAGEVLGTSAPQETLTPTPTLSPGIAPTDTIPPQNLPTQTQKSNPDFSDRR
jgi:hypothetical protein